METNKSIKTLVEKFHLGSATPEELKLLDRMLNHPEEYDLTALMNNEWNEIPTSNGEIDSLALLEATRRRAGIDQATKAVSGGTASIKPIRWLTPLLKYAAVFLLAIVLTWLLKPGSGAGISSSSTHYFNVKVAYGSKTTIELPDSSVVVLNSGSTLSYPDRFESGSRTVKLNGEAYFEVKHNERRPFYVKTKDVTIRVLGTKFNVKSYPEENTSETTLVSGAVEIRQNGLTSKDTKVHSMAPILLKPNQKAIFTRETGKTVLQDLSKPLPAEAAPEATEADAKLIAKIAEQDQSATDIDIAWKDNQLIMNNDRFIDIIKQLERWYNVEITLQSPSLSNVRFSAKFDRESIGDVLNALSIIEPFHYEINKNIITIQKK